MRCSQLVSSPCDIEAEPESEMCWPFPCRCKRVRDLEEFAESESIKLIRDGDLCEADDFTGYVLSSLAERLDRRIPHASRLTPEQQLFERLVATLMKQVTQNALDYSEGEWDKWLAEIEFLRELPYREYLKTDHWIDVRDQALVRALNRCQLCNSPDSLQVHHRTYARLGYEKPEDLTVLCARCHARFHEDKR